MKKKEKCGCTITTKKDGTKVLAPCMACGLNEAGTALVRAGQALMGVAGTVQREAKE